MKVTQRVSSRKRKNKKLCTLPVFFFSTPQISHFSSFFGTKLDTRGAGAGAANTGREERRGGEGAGGWEWEWEKEEGWIGSGGGLCHSFLPARSLARPPAGCVCCK